MDENKTNEEGIVLIVKLNKDGCQTKVTGDTNTGIVKMLIGQLEVIKNSLINDLIDLQNKKVK